MPRSRIIKLKYWKSERRGVNRKNLESFQSCIRLLSFSDANLTDDPERLFLFDAFVIITSKVQRCV